MIAKRMGQSDETEVFDGNDNTPMVATAMRAGAEAGERAGHVEKKEEEKIGLFWRVFGGTLLSIVALVAITLYNNLHSGISELRAEIGKLNEARADLVKKDDFQARLTTNYDRIQSIQGQNNSQNAMLTGYRSELDGLKDRVSRQTTDIDAGKKDTSLVLETLKKDVATLETLKEKLVGLAADAKSFRDEHQKLRQDVDKNQAADAERKAYRDEQHKEHEKTIKEMKAMILDCQVKLARLEGQQIAPKSTAPKPNSTRANTPMVKPDASDPEQP